MKLVIDRKTWWRGRGSCDSSLLRKDGMKCCLGFLGESCGVDNKRLLEHPYPVSTSISRNEGSDKWPPFLFLPNPSAEVRTTLANINDSENLDEKSRERTLIAEFGKHGVEVEFVD